MFTKPEINQVLVVISPDLVKPSAPRQSPLIARALEIAKATGCELEFFHVCYEPSLEYGLFRADANVVEEKKRVTNREAALLAEFVVGLKSEGVTVRHEVRWDHPRTDAILRKIHECAPDLVLKESRDHGYALGFSRNTDWDLIRQSPAPVWFVSDAPSDMSNIITAISLHTDDELEHSNSDQAAFDLASVLATCFKAHNHPVHAYEVPVGLHGYYAYLPDPGMGGAMTTPVEEAQLENRRKEITQEHSELIQVFAESVNLNPADVYLREGHPSDVLPKVAQEVDADLIIMGARNLSRWERLISSVTAEPVLADAPCDVLFVKDPADHRVPVTAVSPIRGTESVNLEHAITEPERTFGSPARVVEETNLSFAFRARILQLWEQDVCAQMVEEGEGGPVRTTKADVLAQISAAKEDLASQSSRIPRTHAFVGAVR